MNEQIEGAIKRGRSYWFTDGFIEIAAGGLFILLAAVTLLLWNAAPVALSTRFLTVAGEISAVKLVGILAAVLLLWWLKERFTYPRTGFVRGKRVTAAQVFVLIRNVLLFLLLPVVALLGTSLLMTSSNDVLATMPVWFPAALGALWAVLLAASGEWLGVRRFRILAPLTLLAGLAVGVWQLGPGIPASPVRPLPELLQSPLLESVSRTLASLSVLLLICGVMLALSGVITFLRYRRANPRPYAEDA